MPHSLQEECALLFGKMCTEHTSSTHWIQIKAHSSSKNLKKKFIKEYFKDRIIISI